MSLYMFTFPVRTNEQIEAFSNTDLLSKSEYEFKVLNVDQKISSSMNDMLVVKLLILQGDGIGTHTLTDYIVMTDKWAFKFKHFCESMGLHKAYEKGELNLKSLEGMLGKLKIDIQKGNPRPDGSGNYPDKNIVTDYIPSEIAKEIKDIFNDDITF